MAELTVGEVPGTFYGLSALGWIDPELFYLWFEQHFLALCTSNQAIITSTRWSF